jgi:hypothetical protein
MKEEEEGMDIIKIISTDNLTIILHKVFVFNELKSFK